MQPAEWEQLRTLIAGLAVIRKPIVLASGKQANYYIDGRLVTLSPEGAYLVARALLDKLSDVEFDAIAGPTIGADPIAGAVAAVSYQAGKPVRGLLVRKEPKSHGTGRMIEGQVEPGLRVVVVDDTVTTGGSLFDSIAKLEAEGCRVVAVTAIVDRLEGAAERFAERGYSFVPLVTVRDFGIDPER